MKAKLLKNIFPFVDKLFLDVDKKHLKRTRNLRLIPNFENRRGGKLSYAEWAHVIGIFQTIIYQTLDKKSGNKILDIGCGTGLLGISCEPFISDGGQYTGIDVINRDVDFCKAHFPLGNYEFIHFDVANPTYSKDQSKEKKPWPIADNSYDLVTGLSVWTHLGEDDSVYYFKQIQRVLKKGGRAIITFFYLDDEYQKSLSRRTDSKGRYHSTNQNRWIFSHPAYNSKNWFSPKWVKNPEEAVGITPTGLTTLLEESGLTLIENHIGNWKEMPGIFFQDILIFEK